MLFKAEMWIFRALDSTHWVQRSSAGCRPIHPRFRLSRYRHLHSHARQRIVLSTDPASAGEVWVLRFPGVSATLVVAADGSVSASHAGFAAVAANAAGQTAGNTASGAARTVLGHFRGSLVRPHGSRRGRPRFTGATGGATFARTVRSPSQQSGRGKTPLRWLDRVKGKKVMRIVGDEQKKAPPRGYPRSSATAPGRYSP
jgi:hypothetical protein